MGKLGMSKLDSGRTGNEEYAVAEDSQFFFVLQIYGNPDSCSFISFLQSEKLWISPCILKLVTSDGQQKCSSIFKEMAKYSLKKTCPDRKNQKLYSTAPLP
ncbi:hypothetical protein TNCT_677341 [Trichonephila clavata]|uniref:Uncharacterized protein n=1 Tax=Trichonephila clavata TaxID=2740835 RepID=A0A8X6L7W7_TRICU|nr:hypothetical protein TNCT_677341 [Trichonephila clavata]